MSCEAVLPRVGAYVDGELRGKDRDEVADHLKACAACSRAADSTQRLDQLAGEETVPAVSSNEWARVRERIALGLDRAQDRESATSARGTARRGRWRVGVPLAAAAALLLAAGLLWNVGERSAPPAGGARDGAATNAEFAAGREPDPAGLREDAALAENVSPADPTGPAEEMDALETPGVANREGYRPRIDAGDDDEPMSIFYGPDF